MARDDFPDKTKRDLSDRVQGYCSNPTCSVQTKGPHSDDEKVDNLGTASHIHAAAPGGPRYDPAQTPEGRKSHGNGIWLCRTCGTLIDTDEVRFPADLLRKWKREAEARARMRLEAHSSESLLDCGAATTAELLRWPSALPDGTWIERPELAQLLTMVRDIDLRPIVLLGAPGSGKSALLARFGALLQADGVHVVAIKADRLPATVRTARDLRDHLGFPIPVASAVCAVGHSGPTVLLIDQLDALSDLVDLKTERLSVLLNLIESVVGADNVRVVCSARVFDFRHDIRFEQLAPRELPLELPTIAVVDQTLSAAGYDPKEMPDALRQLLRTPQWLKAFLGLCLSGRESLPTTWHALAEQVWQRKVGRTSDAAESEAALRLLAKEMADREELWVPHAVLQSHWTVLDRLVSQGLLLHDERGHRIGFAHQLFYEFARARTFLGDESLSIYVLRCQGSLFVRPTLWTALGYLRSADPTRYAAELAALWSSELRRHVRLLLVEFMGQQEAPNDLEASLLLPLLEDASWQLATFSAVAGSPGWFDRLRRGHLKGPMTGPTPGLALQVLSSGTRIAPQATLALLRENWASNHRFAPFTVHVLRHLEGWNEEAFALAEDALSAVDDHHFLDTLVWHLKKHRPDYAIRLIVNSLDTQLTQVLQSVVPSAPLDPNASDREQIAWHMNREPRHSLDELLSSASSKHSYLGELAKLEPYAFLDNFLPWLSRLLERTIESNSNTGCYADDHLVGSKPVDGLPRELPDALQTATQLLSTTNPGRFFELVRTWRSSELLSIHVALTFGLEEAADSYPTDVLEYLLEDPRRLCIGASRGSNRYTVALLSRLGPSLDTNAFTRVERAIQDSEPAAVKAEQPVESRRRAQRHNRRHRLALLRALPHSALSPEARSIVDQEGVVFGEELVVAEHSHGFRQVNSPMLAAQMAQAHDANIVNLFDELVDATQWDHPRRWMQGGSIQASREFAEFAKQAPERAITISEHFKRGEQENPAGEMLRALAETDLPTARLEDLVARFTQRGFESEEFRTDSAWALEKRASDVGDPTISLLVSWMGAATLPPSAPAGERGQPPFLWGLNGGGVSPRGSYPMLAAVTVALLSRKPPEATRWLEVLEGQLARGDSLEVWLAFSRYLRWLRLVDAGRATAFLNQLFVQYPEMLASTEGVQLLDQVSWWLAPDHLRSFVEQLRDGSWSHGCRAFGELVGFLGVREPAVEWAREELATVLDPKCDESARVGAAGACVDLWTSSWRDRCTNVLVKLAEDGGRAEREQILEGLHPSSLVVDQASKRLLVALTTDPEAFLTARTGLAMEWVSGLLHSYPSEVRNLVQRLVQLLEVPGANVSASQSGLETLVNLSLTMQRLPQFREEGLNIFERLLAIGFYGARRALDEADAWPRFRRPV